MGSFSWVLDTYIVESRVSVVRITIMVSGLGPLWAKAVVGV